MSYIFDNAFESFIGLEKVAQARWKRELLKVNDSTLPLFQLDSANNNYELTNIDNPGTISLTTGSNVLTNKDLKDSLFNQNPSNRFYPRFLGDDVRHRLNMSPESTLVNSPDSIKNRPGRKLSDMRLSGAVTLDGFGYGTGDRVINRVVQPEIPGFTPFGTDNTLYELNVRRKNELNRIISGNERLGKAIVTKINKGRVRGSKRYAEAARELSTQTGRPTSVLPKDIPADIPASRLPVVTPKTKGNPTASPSGNNRLRALGYGAAGLAALGGLYGLYKHYND